MVMDRNLLEYLPLVLRDIKEYKVLEAIEQTQFENLWSALFDSVNNQFVSDAVESGIVRYEKILNIMPKGTDTLDVRRFRILARMNEELPYTMEKLQGSLEALCGENGYTAVLDNDEYKLIVRVALGVKGQYEEVDKLLQRITPANIIIDLSLLYNQHSLLSTYTNIQLNEFTNYQIRNEVI